MGLIRRTIGRLLRWGLALLLLLAILVPLLFLGAAVQRGPLLAEGTALTPEQAAASRALVNRVRNASRATEGEQTITATEAELEGLLATGARLVPGLRGEARIENELITLVVAAPLPAGGLWANFALAMGPTRSPFPDLRELRVGRVRAATPVRCGDAVICLSPDFGLDAVRWTLDLLTPSDAGTLLLASLRRMELEPGRVTAVVDGGGLGDDSLFSRLAGGARELFGLEAGERAREHYAAMAAAAAAGELPASGSALPWLRFAVTRVAEAGHESGRAARQDLRAAILAFAAHCGDPGPVETMAGDVSGGAGTSACDGASLRERRDLRKHFALSAAFAAAGSSSVSWGLGEVKELVDAGREGGSGFSFDDVALDRAGIALAERLRRARADEVPGLAAALTDEAAVTPSIEGLPSFMPAAEFRSRFGGVDDPRYARQLAEIDARIAALPFHAR